jgi:hypothetical protein
MYRGRFGCVCMGVAVATSAFYNKHYSLPSNFSKYVAVFIASVIALVDCNILLQRCKVSQVADVLFGYVCTCHCCGDIEIKLAWTIKREEAIH